ncbi:MAG: anti-sigma F factor [Bacilli bacterium]
MRNEMELRFSAMTENVSLSRLGVMGFVGALDLTLDVIEDLKTAVSEAVTNAIIHGYREDATQMVTLRCKIVDKVLIISVTDHGVGIPDIAVAREALYTSRPEDDRSGMGFTIMESFMDQLLVESTVGQGTTVTMTKTLVPQGTVYN